MVESRERLKSLRDRFAELPFEDENGLHRLSTRGEMLIRRVFGESSSYLRTFRDISFWSGTHGTDESYERPFWEQGKNETVNLIDTMLEDLELSQSEVGSRTASAASPELSDRVFVVHGHDDGMKVAVARVLERLSLTPVILHEQPDKGRTIVEKFTDYSDVGFAVVILSPDDMAYPSNKSPSDARPRARQNVSFELGYFVGKLGRENVLALVRKNGDDLEFPSDYSGVLYTPFVEGTWQFKLVRELKASGYNVSADSLL
jgi:predicted nucleotide-binding protein